MYWEAIYKNGVKTTDNYSSINRSELERFNICLDNNIIFSIVDDVEKVIFRKRNIIKFNNEPKTIVLIGIKNKYFYSIDDGEIRPHAFDIELIDQEK